MDEVPQLLRPAYPRELLAFVAGVFGFASIVAVATLGAHFLSEAACLTLWLAAFVTPPGLFLVVWLKPEPTCASAG